MRPERREIAAVSALNRSGPKPTSVAPAVTRASTSPGVKSPSGPMINSPPTPGPLLVLITAGKRGSAPAAASKLSGAALILGKSCASVRGSSSSSVWVLRLCLAAAKATRSSRLVRPTDTAEDRSVMRGVNLWAPSSEHFSTSQSATRHHHLPLGTLARGLPGLLLCLHFGPGFTCAHHSHLQ